jgi:hypothetical protein
LGSTPAPAALELEHCWHRLQKRHAFGLVCGYPMSAFSGEPQRALFEAVCDAHIHVNSLEQTESALAAEQLHRMVARLQRDANSLEQLRPRELEQVVTAQIDPFDDMHRSLARLNSVLTNFSDPSSPNATASTAELLTVEAAALKMRLTRPHVLKLIADHRFNDVVQRAGSLPLIPVREVDRVASRSRTADSLPRSTPSAMDATMPPGRVRADSTTSPEGEHGRPPARVRRSASGTTLDPAERAA